MSYLRFFFIGAFAVFTSAACFDLGGPVIDFSTPCKVDGDCADYVPPFALFASSECNPGYCDKGTCATRKRSGPLPDDNVGDCSKPICRDGTRTRVVDDGDSPENRECQVGECAGGWSSFGNAPEGTPCANGVCRFGECEPDGRDGGPDANDGGDVDGAADASDDG